MRVFVSTMIGRPIFKVDVAERQPLREPGVFARIKKVLIESETGGFVGVAVDSGLHKIIPVIDLFYSIHNKYYYVMRGDAIVDREDVIKLDQMIGSGGIFDKQKIVTESGKFLGQLNDYEVDLQFPCVTQILARRYFVFWPVDTLVPYQNILDVTPKIITVKDNIAFARKKRRIVLKKAEPVIATSPALSKSA